MEKGNKNPKPLYDTNVVSALLTLGETFSDPPSLDESRRVVFWFPNTTKVNQIINEFYQKKCLVPALPYSENIRLCRTLIFTTRKEWVKEVSHG